MIRLCRTLMYLKLTQIFYRIHRQFWKPKVRQDNLPLLTKPWSERRIDFVPKRHVKLTDRKLNLLNQEYDIYEIGWNSRKPSKLWCYNLHYFDYMNTAPILSYNQTTKLIDSWIKGNPIGYGIGWDSYPTSMRIVNWVKWSLSHGKIPPNIYKSLVIQTRWLAKRLERHLLGNHYFANAKALVFASSVFDGAEAVAWKKTGVNILKKELQEQFLADGGHFELSPTYHALLTEDLLDLYNLASFTPIEIESQLKAKAELALQWLTNMTRPDGLPPLFNDAAYKTAPTLMELCEYSKRLNLLQPPSRRKGEGVVDMPSTGYFMYSGDTYQLWGDAGQIGPDYLPAHGHCDMLSFELFAKDRPFIVDTGTSTYENNERRSKERSVTAHNTIFLNGVEQSEIWGAFRVGRRAKIIQRNTKHSSIEAAHNGYQRQGFIHKRKFEFFENRILISDRLVGENNDERAYFNIHFHPKIKIEEYSNNKINTNIGVLKFSNCLDLTLNNYSYAPEFNKLVTAKSAQIIFSGALTTEIYI